MEDRLSLAGFGTPEVQVTTFDGALVSDNVSIVDFGTVLLGQSNPVRTFVVTNVGQTALSLGTLTLPAGFRVNDGLVSGLLPGASDQLTIRMETNILGVKTAQVSFPNYDADENPFNFTITGRVVAPAELVHVYRTKWR